MVAALRPRASAAAARTQRRVVTRMLRAVLRAAFHRLRSRGAARNAEATQRSMKRRAVLRMLRARVTSPFKRWRVNARARNHIVVTKTVKAGKKLPRELHIENGCLITRDPTGKRPNKSYDLLRFQSVHVANAASGDHAGAGGDPWSGSSDFVVVLAPPRKRSLGLFKESAKKIRYSAKSRYDAELIVGALHRHSADAQRRAKEASAKASKAEGSTAATSGVPRRAAPALPTREATSAPPPSPSLPLRPRAPIETREPEIDPWVLEDRIAIVRPCSSAAAAAYMGLGDKTMRVAVSLLPHVHTKYCDRVKHVCPFESGHVRSGRNGNMFVEGEVLRVEVTWKGKSISWATAALQCRWVRFAAADAPAAAIDEHPVVGEGLEYKLRAEDVRHFIQVRHPLPNEPRLEPTSYSTINPLTLINSLQLTYSTINPLRALSSARMHV